jgi:acyl-coenzyme A thioesterase PaaI-like protein
MKEKKAIDVTELFSKVLGEKIENFELPPQSFSVMQAEIIDFNMKEKMLITKIPVLKSWANPYGTMQGGMINAAIDNAVGPLSMLVAPLNFTRTMESKFIKPVTSDLETIYVLASLIEEKKKRLTFDVIVMDDMENVYATAKVVNWIVE